MSETETKNSGDAAPPAADPAPTNDATAPAPAEQQSAEAQPAATDDKGATATNQADAPPPAAEGSTETKPAASNETSTATEGAKPSEEAKPAEEKPAESKPDEAAKPAEATADGESKADTKPPEEGTGEAKPAESTPAESSQPTESGTEPKDGGQAEAKPAEAAATEPAPEAEKQQQSSEDEEKRKELEAKVAEAEKEVEALRKTLEEKTKEADEAAAEGDSVRAQLKDAQERHNNANRVFGETEREKFELQPTYEQCLAGKEQKDRAAQYKKEIDALEKQLKDNEAEVAKLDKEMSDVSAKYADEKNGLEDFSKSLESGLTALHKAVVEKIEKTISAPQFVEGEPQEQTALRQTLALNPFDVLDGLEAIVREREREASHAARQLRELKAICEMKEEEEKKLGSETGDAIEAKKKENDEYIKQLIYGFQDLRANLQADIEEIRKVNKEQAFNLRRGHVEPAKGGATLGAKSTKGNATPRQTAFRKENEKSAELIALRESNEEMQKELNILKKKLAEAVVDRTDSLKTLKSLEHRLQRDEVRFQEDLHKAEAEIAARYVEVERMEKENKRLAEAVEHLTSIVDTTRKQVRHIRSHHDPLPIEDSK